MNIPLRKIERFSGSLTDTSCYEMSMFRAKLYARFVAGVIACCLPIYAQQADVPHAPVSAEQLQQLLDRLSSDEARIKELEGKLAGRQAATVDATGGQTADVKIFQKGLQTTGATAFVPPAPAPVIPSAPPVAASSAASDEMHDPHEHMIDLPGGGPVLKIRGFLDFNFGVGTDANPLIFPLAAYGTPVHSTFQSG